MNMTDRLPRAPLGLSLHSPPTSPSNDPTPEIIVSVFEIASRTSVALFSDSSCATIASPYEQLDITTTLLSPSKRTLLILMAQSLTTLADGIDKRHVSPCSVANLSYEYDSQIPNAPSGLSLHNLSSPGHDSTPEIIVSGVEPLATVELFSDSSCSTSASSQESVLPNESTVNIVANSITSDGTVIYYARQTDPEGRRSICSSQSLSYTYDGTPPDPPSGLSLHNLSTSPSNNSTPEIIVSGVEALATVELFSDNSCTTSVSPQKAERQGESTVNIIANAFSASGTVTYYAHQTDKAGNTSNCSSSSVTYQYISKTYHYKYFH